MIEVWRDRKHWMVHLGRWYMERWCEEPYTCLFGYPSDRHPVKIGRAR